MKSFLQPAFFYLELLHDRKVKDKEQFHPEADVLNHSLQAFYLAQQQSSDVDLIMAALLHDIGKSFDTHQHPKIGAELMREYYSVKTYYLIYNHLRIAHYLDGSMKRVGKRKDLEEHPYFDQLIKLREIDLMARRPDLKLELDKVDVERKLKLTIAGRYTGKYIKG